MADYTLKETEFESIPILEVCYGMDYSKLEPNMQPFNRIVVHRPDSKDYSLDDLISLHMDKLGFGAIGYHFIIDKHGKLYYTRNLAIKGAHAYPNSGKIGISFLRSFDKEEPNCNETSALKKISDALVKRLGIYPIGHNQDQLLELIAKYPDLAEQDEFVRQLWLPSSGQNFDIAKSRLLAGSPQEKQKEMLHLKLCPGALAYKGMVQNALQY